MQVLTNIQIQQTRQFILGLRLEVVLHFDIILNDELGFIGSVRHFKIALTRWAIFLAGNNL